MGSNETLTEGNLSNGAVPGGGNDITITGPVHEVQLSVLSCISALRAVVYIVTAMRAFAIPGARYKYLTTCFLIEALVQALIFLHDFLSTYYGNWFQSVGVFCTLLVTEMQYANSVAIFAYLWIMYFFIFQCVDEEFEPLNRLFSPLFTVTLVASIIDALVKEDPTCVSRQYTGLAMVLMALSKILEVASLVFLSFRIYWNSFIRDKPDVDERGDAILFIIAIAVRLPDHNVTNSFMILGPHVSIALHALPLLWPLYFLIATSQESCTRYNLLHI